jgi:hypothetical protein
LDIFRPAKIPWEWRCMVWHLAIASDVNGRMVWHDHQVPAAILANHAALICDSTVLPISRKSWSAKNLIAAMEYMPIGMEMRNQSLVSGLFLCWAMTCSALALPQNATIFVAIILQFAVKSSLLIFITI